MFLTMIKIYSCPHYNIYGEVGPLDEIDFYIRPNIYARTTTALSYAELNMSLIDVPFVSVELLMGALL